MADLHKALSPLGPLSRLLLVAIVIEAALLLGEMIAVRAIGQHAIAAAMITAPRSEAAIFGACAVVLRITAHALFPALVAFVMARAATRRLFS